MSELISEEILSTACDEITGYLEQARQKVVRAVNIELVRAYGLIGKRIYEIEQEGQGRAAYGEEVLNKLSERLTSTLGRGFSVTNLRYFRQFYLTYKNRIHNEASDEFDQSLSWTHYRWLMKEPREEVRAFYEIEAINNNWSTTELKRQMGSLLYERLAKSRDKEGVLALSREGQVINSPADALKDPVVLEFLGIPESYQMRESDLESALITHLKSFLLEMGKGFAFIARQPRITFNGDNFYPDLVFYHVILKCYVIIELKIHHLSHQDLGQIQMYVNYYDREIKREDDNPTIGLVLCTEKNDEIVHYTLSEENKQIFASKYQFYLPTVEELENFVESEVKELSEKD